MAENSIKWLKGLLWYVAVYHILLGLLAIFAKSSAVSLANWFFNFNLTITPEVYWILNPFAAYLLIFGVFMAVAATDPVKYRNIILVGVVLIVIRALQRIVFVFESPEGLMSNVNPMRNILAIAIIVVIGLAMYLLSRKAK